MSQRILQLIATSPVIRDSHQLFAHQTSWQDLGDRPVGRIRPGSGLPKGLLYTVLALLFVETFLAWRFGYHTT